MTSEIAWYENVSIVAALCGWMVAQFIKLLIDVAKDRRFDFAIFVSTGGFPSAHSALVTALATSVGLRAGFGSALFATTFAFAGIVMFDAQGVRLAAGHQARLLNQIVEELFKEHHLSQQKLVELLGHTRLEVFGGLMVGVICALLIHQI